MSKKGLPYSKIRLLLLFFVLGLYCPHSVGQTIKAVRLSDSLLKQGSFKAAITTYDFPEEIKVLQDKALANLKNDPEWADKHIVYMVQKGDKFLEFLDAYGLTREEFKKMLNGFKTGKMAIFLDTSQITIKKNDGLITFQCSKNLSLFNLLKIDTKNYIIYYDNLKVTRELEINGKFYAPILKGFECHIAKEVRSTKQQSDIKEFGFSIGINKNDTRPVLCLIYLKPVKRHELPQPQFLTITILS